METSKTILLTGAAGFIGSYLLGYLNEQGYEKIILVDDFEKVEKAANYQNKKFVEKVERSQLFNLLSENKLCVEFVIHLGARTDTVEFDYAIHEALNVQFSKNLWNFCVQYSIPMIYASSAATYGNGEMGYSDNHELVKELQPLNPYGISKNEFDKWVLAQIGADTNYQPPFWAGLKFFNVFGPNEYHKGRMASMVYHGYNQLVDTGTIKLFKSHRPDYKDGEQLRDFIYVKDIAQVITWLMKNFVQSGIYNLGTGKARTFNDLAKATICATGEPGAKVYIDMPMDIRGKYQYFTEADMRKLIDAGYPFSFLTLEEAVDDYVCNYLKKGNYY